MTTAVCAPALSAAEIADQVVELMDNKGYKHKDISVAILEAFSDKRYADIHWSFFQEKVRPIVERLRPDEYHHQQRSQPTYAANVHAAYEEAERKAG